MKYCRHCGTGMDDNAAVCLNCGISENTLVKKETAYCKNCGAEMNSQAAICIKCGVSQTNKNRMQRLPRSEIPQVSLLVRPTAKF